MAAPGQHLTVNCERCGTPFRQARTDHRFCTPACAQRGWKERRESAKIRNPCVECGTTIPRRREKFCSDACGAKNNADRKRVVSGPGKGWSGGEKRVPRQTCEVCAGFFYAPPSQILRGGGKFCSVGCRGVFMSKHPESFPQVRSRRGVGGRREDLGDRYFRSSWEANYARYLNWLVAHGQIDRWEYEVDVFEFPIKRGTRTYLPDFKVWTKPDRFEYHEVKGYMDQRSRTKLDRMARYHPDVPLTLIDKDVYKTLSQQISALIPEWEFRRSGTDG